MTNTAKLRPLFFALVFTVAASLVPQLARAQALGALPTAPAASRAAIGGYTAARASLPGENGSPLEPYLFLFILAGGGIVWVAFAIGADRYVRRSYRPSRPV